MSTGYKPQTLGVPDDLRAALDGSHIALPIDMVQVLDRMRQIDENAMAAMLDSIEAVGLMNPIQVREARDENGKSAHYLVAGRQRLEAYRRKFTAAYELPEGPERDKALGRWSRIPAIVYPEVMTADQAVLLEVVENLDRRDLTPAERKTWAAKKAELLAKVRPSAHAKTGQHAKHATWHAPKIRDAAETCGTPFETFQKWYRQFKAEHHGKDWNKQTEPEYLAFLAWLKDAEQRAADEAAKKVEEANAKGRAERVTIFAKMAAKLQKEDGDLAIIDGLREAGLEHLLGGDDGR